MSPSGDRSAPHGGMATKTWRRRRGDQIRNANQWLRGFSAGLSRKKPSPRAVRWSVKPDEKNDEKPGNSGEKTMSKRQ
jgi:hypothetical protein